MKRIGSIEAARRLGVTYRQLDYWCRVHLTEHAGMGSGGRRLFTLDDLLHLAVIGAVYRHAPNHASAQLATDALRAVDLHPDPGALLVDHGVSVYATIDEAVTFWLAGGSPAAATFVDLRSLHERLLATPEPEPVIVHRTASIWSPS